MAEAVLCLVLRRRSLPPSLWELVRTIVDSAAEQVLGALPVAACFRAQPGASLGTSLRFQQIAQPHSQPEAAQKAETEWQAQFLGLCARAQLFPKFWLVSERHTACSEDRLRLST
jgi:hypothetical protein